MLRHGWPLGLMLLVGCAGSPTRTDAGADAGADVAVDAPVDAPADAPVDVAEDAPRGTCETDPVAEIPSRQTVSFRFAPGRHGYLISAGMQCSPVRIEQLDTIGVGPLPLGLLFQCLCECPQPPGPSVTRAERLDGRAEAYVATWDARALTTCTHVVDCAARGWPGHPQRYQFETRGFAQPVEAGRFRATFALVDSVPPHCTADTDGTLHCSPLPSGGVPPTAYDLCPGDRTVSVDFDLPASGDVTVDVPAS